MLYLAIGILAVVIDQLVKFLVSRNLGTTGASVVLIPDVLKLVNVQNSNAVFSFLRGENARIWFVVLTSVFVILFVVAIATKIISGRFGRLCLTFIAAGGISNLIDRIRFGYVVDVFGIDLFDSSVFNVADLFMAIFCIAFVFYVLFSQDKYLIMEMEREMEEDEELLPGRKQKKTTSETVEVPVSKKQVRSTSAGKTVSGRVASGSVQKPASRQTSVADQADEPPVQRIPSSAKISEPPVRRVPASVQTADAPIRRASAIVHPAVGSDSPPVHSGGPEKKVSASAKPAAPSSSESFESEIDRILSEFKL